MEHSIFGGIAQFERLNPLISVYKSFLKRYNETKIRTKPAIMLILFLLLITTIVYMQSKGIKSSDQNALEKRFVSSFEYGENSSRSWKEENISEQLQWQIEEDKTEVMWEVTKYDKESDITDENLESAWRLYKETFENAEENGWFNWSQAKKQGFYSWENDRLHYPNKKHIQDSRTLDPSKPETLLYANTEQGRVLVGVMYITKGPDEPGHQVAGPLTVWHYHLNDKQKCRKYNVIPKNTEKCPNGNFTYRGPEMMHVWFIKHPDGPFATSMTLPSSKIKKPEMLKKSELIERIERKYKARSTKEE